MEQRNQNRPKRIVLWSIAVLLTVLVVVTVAFRLIFPILGPIPTTGEYAIASVLHTYTDEDRIEAYSARNAFRKVNAEYWYPENTNDQYPLVIFSHGGLGIRSSNISLYRELASHGYVVVALDHPYQAFWSRDAEGKLTFLSLDYFAELQREDAKTEPEQSLTYYQQWMEIRMDDINLVLDTILKYAASDRSGVYSLVDITKIGVMGHSLGGSAALGIGRQRDDINGVIALEAPFLYEIVGVEDEKFMFIDQDYPTPVLIIYSDDSWPYLAEWPQYALNHALLRNPANAYHVHISGVGHLALTDLALSSPFLVRVLDTSPMTRQPEEALLIINRVSLHFFDHFLKNLGEFPVE